MKGILVVGCVAGMGFTMSLFICQLAFDGDLLAAAKLAVLIGSTLAALLGSLCGIAFLKAVPRAPSG